MISLKPVDHKEISPWMRDYQQKSKNFEMPPENAESVGIYRGDKLIGYFIIVFYPPQGILEINQGYLEPSSRHKNLSKVSMELLEKEAKRIGIKKIMLATNRAVGSYLKFMRSMDYEIEKAIFAKEVH